jgi:hypothetical protein
MVGARLSEGLKEGASLGTKLGTSLGFKLGVLLGFEEGNSEGTSLGFKLGVLLGFEEGNSEGSLEGRLVGGELGLKLGLEVGESVGDLPTQSAIQTAGQCSTALYLMQRFSGLYFSIQSQPCGVPSTSIDHSRLFSQLNGDPPQSALQSTGQASTAPGLLQRFSVYILPTQEQYLLVPSITQSGSLMHVSTGAAVPPQSASQSTGQASTAPGFLQRCSVSFLPTQEQSLFVPSTKKSRLSAHIKSRGASGPAQSALQIRGQASTASYLTQRFSGLYFSIQSQSRC